MTDLEMTKLCAEAMGYSTGRAKYQPHYQVWVSPKDHDPQCLPSTFLYDPLHDDAQAMALVKKFNLTIRPGLSYDGTEWWSVEGGGKIQINTTDLNRAIVECVAKMQEGR